MRSLCLSLSGSSVLDLGMSNVVLMFSRWCTHHVAHVGLPRLSFYPIIRTLRLQLPIFVGYYIKYKQLICSINPPPNISSRDPATLRLTTGKSILTAMMPQAVKSAVSSDSLEIPLIDFQAFLSGDERTKRSTAQAILNGFQLAGFIYLKNHGIPKEKVQTTFRESAKFFTRPETQKLDLGWTTPQANRGYSQPGREKTTDSTDPAEIEKIRTTAGPDLKESFEIGREGEEGLPNHWPDFDEEGKVFKQRMLEFHDVGKNLHMLVMRAIAVGLGIEETYFDGYCQRGDNTLRLLHYPSVNSEVFQKNKLTVRAGAHTDYGSMTLLFQVSTTLLCKPAQSLVK